MSDIRPASIAKILKPYSGERVYSIDNNVTTGGQDQTYHVNGHPDMIFRLNKPGAFPTIEESMTGLVDTPTITPPGFGAQPVFMSPSPASIDDGYSLTAIRWLATESGGGIIHSYMRADNSPPPVEVQQPWITRVDSTPSETQSTKFRILKGGIYQVRVTMEGVAGANQLGHLVLLKSTFAGDIEFTTEAQQPPGTFHPLYKESTWGENKSNTVALASGYNSVPSSMLVAEWTGPLEVDSYLTVHNTTHPTAESQVAGRFVVYPLAVDVNNAALGKFQ